MERTQALETIKRMMREGGKTSDDILKELIASEVERRVQEAKQELHNHVEQITPKKGVHYFDGVNGHDGIDGLPGKDGKDGRHGRNGLDGRDGKDGENISPKQAKMILAELLNDVNILGEKDVLRILDKPKKGLDGKLKKLEELVMLNYGGHGGHNTGGATPQSVDLSAQLDGLTKSFTIPANTAIIGVFGSSAPFIFRPTTDYTGSGTTTITFTASVDAPSALATGQSLIVQYY